MATATPPQAGLTAKEFAARPDPGYPEELVRGRIVRMSPPGSRHGEICAEVVGVIRGFVKENGVGRVVSNDSGVVTRRDPDTVRGADVAYYSYVRIPRGPLPVLYPAVAPELVVEVRSPGDRWPEVLAKVVEYLEAGVGTVCVIDDETRSVQVYDADRPVRILSEGDDLAFPELLPGFRVPLRQLFE